MQCLWCSKALLMIMKEKDCLCIPSLNPLIVRLRDGHHGDYCCGIKSSDCSHNRWKRPSIRGTRARGQSQDIAIMTMTMLCMIVTIIMMKRIMMMMIEQLSGTQGKIIIKLSAQQIEEWQASELEPAPIGTTEYISSYTIAF